MRFVQFRVLRPSGAFVVDPPRLGVLLGDGQQVGDLSAALAARGLSVAPDAPSLWDLDGLLGQAVQSLAREAVAATGAALDEARRSGRVLPLAEVKLAAPVPRPGKVVCIGLNYRDHAIESNMPIPESPIAFSKFATSICGPGDTVVIPPGSKESDYEAELAVIIGRRAKNVARGKGMDFVFGYSCFNDVSARDFQFADKQWQRGKSPDTFAPIGPFVATADEIPNPENLGIRLRLNGQTMQNSNTNQLIFGIAAIIEFLSSSITLEPGDVIATGTPPGVGFARKPPVYIKNGDVMEVEIDGLGVLTNPVTGPRS